MATGIQTGIRTGSAPLSAGKGPGGSGGIGKVLAAWNGMSARSKLVTCVVVGVLVVGGLGMFAYQTANKPTSLYATNLAPGDVSEITRRLNEWSISYTVEGSKIMVHPGERSRLVGLLLNFGLPHRSLTNASESGGMSPKTEFEKRQMALDQLQAKLIEEIRYFDPVADVYVNLVLPSDDDVPSAARCAKATVMLQLKSGARPKKEQIEAIQSLVAGSVMGLDVKNVSITDNSGKVWTDKEGRIASTGISPGAEDADPSSANNEQLAIKRGYDAYYKKKIEDALDGILGRDKYKVTVNAEFDFSQTQIRTTQVGDPAGNNQVVTLVKTDKEVYKNTPRDGKTKQARVTSPTAGGKDDQTAYTKVKYETKTESGKVERTAVIPPGVVKNKTATVAIDGRRDPVELENVKKVASSAMGINENMGDRVEVVAINFDRNPVAVVPGAFPEGGLVLPGRSGPNNTRGLLLVGMLVPTCILLGILGVFLLRQRRVMTEKTGLILTTTPGATTSDISDLLSDKIGRSTATNQTTRANNTEQLEKLAKEKPTKVAELLKSTWLSDKER